MRKETRESYDVKRGNGTESRCCVADAEQLRNLKEENIRDMKWRPADRRTGGRAKRIKTKTVKQEDASKYRNGPVLQECVTSGINVDGSGYRSGEARNSSMEKYGPPSGERRM